MRSVTQWLGNEWLFSTAEQTEETETEEGDEVSARSDRVLTI